jgi:Protein of unknown function (DUF4236)
MPWLWRKVFSFGPARVTLSNRGWGWSLGLPFLRYGIGPSGARYISIGLPGTGLYFTKILGRGLGSFGRSLSPQVTQQNPNTSSSAIVSHLTANQKIVLAYKNKCTP